MQCLTPQIGNPEYGSPSAGCEDHCSAREFYIVRFRQPAAMLSVRCYPNTINSAHYPGGCCAFIREKIYASLFGIEMTFGRRDHLNTGMRLEDCGGYGVYIKNVNWNRTVPRRLVQ